MAAYGDPDKEDRKIVPRTECKGPRRNVLLGPLHSVLGTCFPLFPVLDHEDIIRSSEICVFRRGTAMTTMATALGCDDPSGIPAPIVKLNRSMLLIGVLAALALRQPLITTLLFIIVAGAALFGRRGSLVFAVGSRLFRSQNAVALAEGRYD